MTTSLAMYRGEDAYEDEDDGAESDLVVDLGRSYGQRDIIASAGAISPPARTREAKRSPWRNEESAATGQKVEREQQQAASSSQASNLDPTRGR
jgi:hypothetical protein